jgi:uncharacterized protein (DUF1778 family)
MARSSAARKPIDRPIRATRLGIRIDPETKSLVERAAALERRTVTDFCLRALTAASRQAIEKNEVLVLTERDRRTFFEVLMNPPKPNARLRRAFRASEDRIQ